MDLVTHIPGIANSASFTPGANTPAPYNVTHTGLTDGTSPGTASKNQAEIYNRWLLTQAAVITQAGLTIDNTNWTQMATAITTLAAAGGGGSSNTFTTIAVAGQTSVAADTTTDTLTLVAGTNVTITTDASTDTITINAASGGGGGGWAKDYVRQYTGTGDAAIYVGYDTNLGSNWLPLVMDATALYNRIGTYASDYDSYRTLLKGGNTYYYELSVVIKNNNSDTNDATYTALVENPPGGVGTHPGTDNNGDPIDISNLYTIISRGGVAVTGDWQTTTIHNVGSFYLSADTCVSPAVMTTDYNPNMTRVCRQGFTSLIWSIWRSV